MNKRIIASLAMIALVIAGVTSATVAYFSDTVTVTGVTVAMGTADLELNHTTTNTDEGYDANSSDLINLGLNVGGLYPGLTVNGNVWLRNVSQSPIALRPYARLTRADSPHGDDWTLLKDKIEIRITDKGHDGSGTYSWGWRTLEWWHTESRPVSDPVGILPESNPDGVDKSHQYLIEARVRSDAGNEIQGKSLTNVTWEIVGQQVY
ncbi:MAG: hypothetical protein ACPLXP_00615 [Microgenomates group bacterium]